MAIKIIVKGREIRFLCPVCGVSISRPLPLEKEKLETTCGVCGSVLLYTEDKRGNEEGMK